MGIVQTVVLFAVSLVLAGGSISPATEPSERSVAAAPSAALGQPTPQAPVAEDAVDGGAEVSADERRAVEVLAELKSRYRYLDDVSVSFGPTPKGHEAVAFYTDGEILISDTHTVGVYDILAHEVWHVIDWRDNGRLDWGEDLPPRNSADYLK